MNVEAMIDSVVLQLCYVSGDVDDSHFRKSTWPLTGIRHGPAQGPVAAAEGAAAPRGCL
jgi:hypothetical protein